LRYPAILQPKLDGEFNYAYLGEKSYLVNKSGVARYDWPKLDEIASKVGHDSILVGELIWALGGKGCLYELLAHRLSDELDFRAFDIVRHKGENILDWPLIDRIELLSHLQIPQVSHYLVNSDASVGKGDETRMGTLELFAMLAGPYEGVVVKSTDSRYITGPCEWVKLKAKDISAFPVIFIDPVRERIEIAVPTPVTPPGSINTKRVGVKVTDVDKKSLVMGDMVKIEHQGILVGGGLRHPVYKGKV